jgi:RNA polymerase sigma-70 factor (ECF subfamily)
VVITVETDWNLVTLAQTGDMDAFAELYSRHADPVFAFTLKRVHSVHLAEDLTSETFLRALRRINSVTYEGTGVRAWLYVIARHLILDHYKSSCYKRELSAIEGLEFPTDQDDPEQAAVKADTAAYVRRHIDQLSVDQRRCIELRFLHEMTRAETAVVMDRNEVAVRALQNRAVRKLAAMMGAAA